MDISATEFLKTGIHTAEHFGFQSIDALKRNPVCKNCSTKLANTSSATDRRLDALHGLLVSGACSYTDARLFAFDEPVLFYSIDQVPRSGDVAISLHVFGVAKSIAEAMLIQAMRAFANELGFENNVVRINSLGDRDSSTRYMRELTNYLRKRLDDMPASARELMKEHAFVALMHLIEKEHDLAYRSPNPLEHLSDQSRKHFREIVEYLDMSEIPYEIDPKLLGHHHCYSDALFAIDILNEEGAKVPDSPMYIRGGRYNEFMTRHTKRDIPASGAVAVLREKKAPARTPRSGINTTPSVYIVQLGFGPKIKSLLLVDELRKEHIPVFQNLTSDSLSAQLRDAEARKVKYTIIIGQKEFVEETVILRDMEARNQQHVPIRSLISQLRRMTKVHA